MNVWYLQSKEDNMWEELTIVLHAKVEDLCELTNFLKDEWERRRCMLTEMDEKIFKLEIQT
jgi:hypothetical protein